MVATVAAGLVGTTTSAAQAATPVRGAGYVWAHSPGSWFYVTSGPYSYNSSTPFGASNNTVTKLGIGRYRVTYPNLGVTGGTVHVTAYGGGNEQCKVDGWGPNLNGGQDVMVHCFSLTGQLVDTLFTTTFTNQTIAWPGTSLAYLWANDPFASFYYPDSFYQFNTSGAVNSILRNGVGFYTVELPNLGSFRGHVQVTAYGTGNERCKVVGWQPSGTSLLATVRCFALNGAPADTRFTLTFADQINILDLQVFSGTSGHPSTYAWAHDPTAAGYPPAPSYAFGGSWPPLFATRTGVGTYGMRIGSDARFGNVQITAYGWDSEYCKVAYWNESDGVQVRCFDAAGSPVNTRYDMAFTGPLLIG